MQKTSVLAFYDISFFPHLQHVWILSFSVHNMQKTQTISLTWQERGSDGQKQTKEPSKHGLVKNWKLLKQMLYITMDRETDAHERSSCSKIHNF